MQDKALNDCQIVIGEKQYNLSDAWITATVVETTRPDDEWKRFRLGQRSLVAELHHQSFALDIVSERKPIDFNLTENGEQLFGMPARGYITRYERDQERYHLIYLAIDFSIETV